MSYLYIVFADVLLGMMFILNKKYQSIVGSDVRSGLRLNLALGLVGLIIFLVINGFSFEFSWYSFKIALITQTSSALYTILGLKILKDGKVSFFSIFLMMGGMIIPFLYGVILGGEKLSIFGVLGIIAMIIAIVFINFDGKKPSKKQIAISLVVFFLNGIIGIFSKIHQSNPLDAVDTKSFVIIGSFLKFTICFIVYSLYGIIYNKKHGNNNLTSKQPICKKNHFFVILLLLGMSVSNSSSYFFQLLGAIDIPASVLYPLLSGGSILITSIFGRVFYKDKYTKVSILGVVFSVLGTIAFI